LTDDPPERYESARVPDNDTNESGKVKGRVIPAALSQQAPNTTPVVTPVKQEKKKEMTKQSPKPKPKATQKEKTTQAPKAQPKTTPKEMPKMKPKTQPKSTPKMTAKAEPKALTVQGQAAIGGGSTQTTQKPVKADQKKKRKNTKKSQQKGIITQQLTQTQNQNPSTTGSQPIVNSTKQQLSQPNSATHNASKYTGPQAPCIEDRIGRIEDLIGVLASQITGLTEGKSKGTQNPTKTPEALKSSKSIKEQS